MGLLDKVLNKGGASDASTSSQSSLVSAVLSTLQSGGGLHGLVQQFTANGMGHVVQSWIGKGSNQPISSDQVRNALGSEKINEIAGKAGVSPEEASTGLSKVLPEVVDHLTPNGEIPSGDVASKGIDMLKQKIAS